MFLNFLHQIKSDWRSALGRDALNDLMTVILTSSEINEFDSKDAIEMWLTSGLRQRRPTFIDEELDSTEEEDLVRVGLANVEQDIPVCDSV